MHLPFTEAQFLSGLADYNVAFTIPIIALWLLTAAVLVVSTVRHIDRWVAGLLALHWLWSGVLYHWLYFTRINPAARVFGALFVLQAVLFLWFGVVRRRLEFRWGRHPRQLMAAALVAYGLVYPALVLASGLRWPSMPVFGVPCPTTLVSLGLLLTVAPGTLRGLSVIPVLWAAVGGSAAILLGVFPDYMLLVGGAVVLIHVI
jgi:uncharacterized protein DUF6064